MPFTYTAAGQKSGSGVEDALWKAKFGGKVFATMEHALVTSDLFVESPASQVKQIENRWTGDVVGREFTRGQDLMDPATDFSSMKSKFMDYITKVDPVPIFTRQFIHDFDEDLSPSPDQDQMKIAHKMGYALARMLDLRAYSSLLQIASMPTPDVFPATNPYITKLDAGGSGYGNFSTGSGGADSLAGLHVEPNLTVANATGNLVEQVTRKIHEAFDAMGFPGGPENRILIGRSALLDKVIEDSGRQVSNGNSAPVSKSLDEAFAGGVPTGSFPAGRLGQIWGFEVRRDPWLTNFGTRIENMFGDPGGAGSKYMPGTGWNTGATSAIYGINGQTIANGVFEVNDGASNPTSWNSGGNTVRELFNNVQMIAVVKREAAERRWWNPVKVERSYQHRGFGFLSTVRSFFGHGPLNSMAVIYVVNAKPSA